MSDRQWWGAIVAALFSCWACQPTGNTEATSVKSAQQIFWQQTAWESEDSFLSQKLDSLQIGAWQVYQHCRQKKPLLARKLRLISAVCQKAGNRINSLDTSYWGGILYRMKPFVELIQVLKEPQHHTFVDVGSGNGEKLYAALCLGFDHSEGLEYDSTLVSMSRHYWQPMIKRQKMSIRWGNALTIAANYYQQFDFIYLYSPIRKHVPMARLFYTLMQQLKEGGVLLEVRMVYAQALRKVSGYDIPNLMGTFALKKQGGRLYYVRYSNTTKDWILLEKKKSQ
ncbi:class I SAM-dependent methyltransferase [Microscilla marina]|uniref:Lipoprotein, putative n=1 Tax=Microscilla marina ATCC 23134 TaxID=313606 RepID=A1ZZG7_MICM2|nr:class I SAM-dependent methyltransferase [Microscilla marina]EAY24213.1 lipoprotein, putative [Microscilla marina ATCC 23134]